MMEDITFCPAEGCGNAKCPINKAQIEDRTRPHSFYVRIPKQCPNGRYRSEGKEKQFSSYRRKR